MPIFPLLGIISVLIGAFIGGSLAKKFGQPLILGYLFAGLFLSFLFNRFNLDKTTLKSLSEIGLTFLMFTLGLEFSFKKTEKLKGVIVGGSLIQIGLTVALGIGLLVFIFKFDLQPALILACAFSLSSTAIIFKILAEKGLLESLSGEIMKGWLLVQDLAALPMIAVFPIIFNHGNLVVNLLTLVKAAAVIGFLWIVTKKIIPHLAETVAYSKNREILLIFAIGLIFLFSGLTQALGFSLGAGAFLAGLLLSRATVNLAVFSEIRPLRDVFLAIFFVCLGFTLDFSFLLNNIGNVLLISASILFLKMAVVAFILLFFGYHGKAVFFCGFGLAQVGEFAFILVSAAAAAGSLGLSHYNLAAAVTLLTMVVSPWLFSLGRFFYLKTDKWSAKSQKFRNFFIDSDKHLLTDELPFENHVVILGYGRVGRWIGCALDKSKIPYLVVDYDQDIIRELRLQEKRAVFGDPADVDVLDYVQVDKAKLVVLAIPDSSTTKIVVANCQTLNPRIKIICRSHVEEDKSQLRTMGVSDIIQPEFEGALSMAHRAMQYFGLGKEEISLKIKEIKKEHGG